MSRTGQLVTIVDDAGNPAGAASSAYAAITPSDTVALSTTPKAIYIGGSGNLTVKGSNGISATFAVTAGQVVNIAPSFVMATGTTATGIVALN